MLNDLKIRGLGLFSGLMLVMAAVALAWGALVRVDADHAAIGAPTLLPAWAPSPAIEASVGQLSPLWTKDIRQFADGNAPAAQASSMPTIAASAAPAMNVKLVATAVDAERSFAIFADADQNSQVCTLGQMIDGMKVVTIESQRVVLDRDGQRFSLVVPDQFDLPAGAATPPFVPAIDPNATPPSTMPATPDANIPQYLPGRT